jgi:FixJ family two-component response regulator
MNDQPTVFVVDDDASVRRTLVRSLKYHGYKVVDFNNAESFLVGNAGGQPGCLVLDVAMPGMTGLELQAELTKRGWSIPIIFVTGHGDIPTSVRAIKEGAIDFLEKPFRPDVLRSRIDQALEQDLRRRSIESSEQEIRSRFETLTARERQVMTLMVAGAATRTNKEMARILEISHRTVDEHRANIMRKMHPQSITDLADMAKVLGVHQA